MKTLKEMDAAAGRMTEQLGRMFPGQGYEVRTAVAGDYFRLIRAREGDQAYDLICGDSACDDLYDEDTALGMFIETINDLQ